MTYHLIIKVDKLKLQKAYDLFENIQNDYSLYDNCTLDDISETGGKAHQITIESTDGKALKSLAKELKKKYKIKNRIRVVKVGKADTIIDEGRDEETGGFPV